MSQVAAWLDQPPHDAAADHRSALIIGRAFHSPWTEGTRVINRNFARVASQRRPICVLSITHDRLRELTQTDASEAFPVEHIFTPSGYGAIGSLRAVPLIIHRLNGTHERHAGVAHLFGVPLSIAPWLRQRGIRVISHVMAVSLRGKDRLLVRASVALFKPWINAFAATSEVLLPHVTARGIPDDKLFVIPPAIDTSVFRPLEKRLAKSILQLDPDEPLLLYLGRVSPRRFPAEKVAAALSAAASSYAKPVRFIALSPDRTFDGSENSTAYLRECSLAAERALTRLPGVRAEVRLASVDEKTKVTFLQAADAVLFPFEAPEVVEPPLTLIEAMACGATIIATPAANRSALIVSGHNGYICADQQQFAARLAQVLTCLGGNSVLPENARSSALQRHSFAAVGAATAQVWQHLEPDFAPVPT